MDRVAKFEKVSFEEYYKAMKPLLPSDWTDDEIRTSWEDIELPTRATSGSAGYDFYAPVGFTVSPGHPVLVPTGIRAKIEPGWFLMCLPRSGLGFKHGVSLANTAGVIDSDYYFSDNEGHIMAKVCSRSEVEVEYGHKFMQGIFLPFGITENDCASETRNGGFGSTDKEANDA